MLVSLDRSWSARVNRVFDTQPRDGANPESVWLPREKVESQFNDLLYQDGVHICVDGPSGTGKTSLVKTQLSKEKKKVIPIQLTQSMRWTDLCREIVGDISKADSNFGIDALLSLTDLPSIKLSYNRKKKSGANLATWKALGSQLNELDLCRALQATGSVLFIDDFEKAHESIVVRIADICKLMTQSFKGKIVIAGTGDIYFQLMTKEPALESRLVAMSIGVLPNADDGWDFLNLGFDKLGIMHPAKVYNRRSASTANYAELRACKVAIHDAVASLPKALNEFGRKACLTKAKSAHRLSFSDLIEVAKETFYAKVDEYAKQFPKMRSMLEKLEVRLVLRAIYRRQIGSILKCEEIYREAANEGLSRDQFDDALSDLVKADVVTQTGRNGETLFVTNLYLAHIFGVCADKFSQYNLDPKIYGAKGQLSLPLKDKSESSAS